MSYLMCKFSDNLNHNQEKISKYIKNLKALTHKNINIDISSSYDGLNLITARSSTFLTNQKSTRTVIYVILAIVLGIALFLISFIIKKRIENNRRRFGVLKALGYKNWQISVGITIYPVIFGIVSVILSILPSFYYSHIISNSSSTLYQKTILFYQPQFPTYVIALFFFIIIFGILAFIVSYLSLREKTTLLIYQTEKNKLQSVFTNFYLEN